EFAGQSLIDPRRAVQLAHLVFRAVELGMLSIAALAAGFSVRVLLNERLRFSPTEERTARRQFGLPELRFLTIVFAMGAWMLSLFFDHFDREAQLQEIVLTTLRALPAVLPVLWLAMQSNISRQAAILVVSLLLGVMLIKAAIEYTLTGDE